MPKTLAESFSEELENWNESIQFYSIEIESIDSKLYEVIRRNSIPGIAAKVNTYQVRLNNLSEKFDSILESIDDQEAEIKVDGHLVEDALLHYEVEKEQEELRKKMKGLEKSFIDVKFDCHSFLTGSLKN